MNNPTIPIGLIGINAYQSHRLSRCILLYQRCYVIIYLRRSCNKSQMSCIYVIRSCNCMSCVVLFSQGAANELQKELHFLSGGAAAMTYKILNELQNGVNELQKSTFFLKKQTKQRLYAIYIYISPLIIA